MARSSLITCIFCVYLLALVGCVERRMTLISDPPAALAFVNNQEIGPTPVDVPSDMFLYHGDHDIKLVRDGFEPLVVKQPVPPKWYQRFPFDFFSENIVPWYIRDHRVFEYQLSPRPIVPQEELLGNAEAHRNRGRTIGNAPPMPRPPSQ